MFEFRYEFEYEHEYEYEYEYEFSNMTGYMYLSLETMYICTILDVFNHFSTYKKTRATTLTILNVCKSVIKAR